MVGYIQRFSERGARRIAGGQRARHLGDVGKSGLEVLNQLFIRLLGIGPAAAVSQVQEPGG